jgi:cytoskeleton protein RodZ
MSENGQSPVGQVLREARLAQSLTIEDVAARLRLMQRQIEAMETDDFGSLGQPVFARGFVRNYARLLGLEPDALLMRMEGAPAELVAVRQPELSLQRSWLASPWLVFVLLGLFVLVTAPVALYWWLNEGEDELVSQVHSSVQVEPVPLAAVPASAPVDAVEPQEALAPVATPVADLPPAQPAAQPAASTVAPVAAPSAPAKSDPAPATPASPVRSGTLHFEFGGDAWVEIKDASGRVLHRQNNPAGSSVNVRGQPPFELVVGNAAQAKMTYNNRPIDLKPFIDVSVARFTLEE